MIDRDVLQRYIDTLLDAPRFPDYGPNGLQIEGIEEIDTIAFAVSATADSIRRAVDAGAQALIVHHGLFWKFHGARPLTGPFARRVFPLIQNGINLLAYHLPLDAHPEIGNAASLGRLIGLTGFAAFGDHQGMPTGIKGELDHPQSAQELRARLAVVLNHPILLSSPDETAPIRSVGIITGGANGDWARAAKEGLDAYITGEMSEHDWHEAQEVGIHMFAGGHHATESFGIQALMAVIEREFEVTCFYIDSINPA